jgi:cystathionine gamma-synthase
MSRPLGAPLPDAPHAVSVSLPRWADVVGYEEGDPAVLAALAAGYPRFVLHPAVRALADRLLGSHGQQGEQVLPFPTPGAAARCLAHLARAGHAGRAVAADGVTAVYFRADAAAVARQAWQHAGEIVSSRQAEAVLAGRPASPLGPAAKAQLREQLGDLAGVPAAEVRLFPSGMAAIAQALRLVLALHPGRPTAQLGFPYVDTLKLQERIGAGCHFFPVADEAAYDALAELLAAGRLAAVFTEVPTNPLMQVIDLPRLSRLARAAGVPLVVDDSAATFFNLELRPYADVLVSSLTKHFAGQGDAMGGCLALDPGSPLYGPLAALAAGTEDALWGDDAVALAEGGHGFAARMAAVNASAERLARALAAHPAVARVHHPALTPSTPYAALRRPGGGHGGLLSLELRDGARLAPGFYDRLAVEKGPSFGIAATLACPYTLLAHYHELDWAERCGVSRHLIRVSVGLEPAEDLVARFEAALANTMTQEVP